MACKEYTQTLSIKEIWAFFGLTPVREQRSTLQNGFQDSASNWVVLSQPYLSLFLVGGVRGRENYIWTLWPASCAMKECNNCCRSRKRYANYPAMCYCFVKLVPTLAYCCDRELIQNDPTSRR